MKKIYSILLIMVLLSSLSACKTPVEEVESGALAETPVEEQETVKEEQTPETEKEEVQEPNQETPEEPDTTQPPENTPSEEREENSVEKEPEMENHLVCSFRIYLKEEHPGYTMDDFPGLGAEQLESYPNSSIYTLYGTYTDVKDVETVMDSLFSREEIKNIELKYEVYRVEKGADATSYPSLERAYNVVDSSTILYNGRVGVNFEFEDRGYHHLLTLADFSEISAEACYFECQDNKVYGYINLTDDSKEAINKAIIKIQAMPGIKTAEQYRDSYSVVE